MTRSRVRNHLLAATALVLVATLMAPAAPAGAVVVIEARLESPTITLGQTAKVVGEVNSPAESPRVVLQRKIGTEWFDRDGARVNPDTGAFTIVLHPTNSGPYTLRVRTQGGTVVSGSFTLQVNPVRTTITARLSENYVTPGTLLQVTGVVTPPRATPRVVLQRRINGRWYDRGMAVVDRETGAYTLSVRPSQNVTHTLRVRSGGGTVVSRTLYLIVGTPMPATGGA